MLVYTKTQLEEVLELATEGLERYKQHFGKVASEEAVRDLLRAVDNWEIAEKRRGFFSKVDVEGFDILYDKVREACCAERDFLVISDYDLQISAKVWINYLRDVLETLNQIREIVLERNFDNLQLKSLLLSGSYLIPEYLSKVLEFYIQFQKDPETDSILH